MSALFFRLVQGVLIFRVEETSVKRKFRKSVLLLLTVLLCFFGDLKYADAKETQQENMYEMQTTEFEANGIDSVSTMIADAISQKQAENSALAAESNYIQGLVINEKTAEVTFCTEYRADIIVAVYDETMLHMFGSGKCTVSAGSNSAAVEISAEKMPEFFMAAVYMLDTESHEALCDPYITSMYVQSMQDLKGSTVNDYDEELVLNLDNDPNTNFAVYNADTVFAAADGEINQITDNGDGSYTITNADSSFTSMKAGDTFSYAYGDGDILLVKAAAVFVDGTTVTVTKDSNADLTDFFDYIKLEATEDGSNLAVDNSNLADGVTYLGSSEEAAEKAISLQNNIEDDSTKRNVQSRKARAENKKHDISKNITHSYEFKEKLGPNLTLDGSISSGFTIKFSYYISLGHQHISFGLDYEAVASVSVSGKIDMWELSLGEIKGPLITGVNIGFTPKFVGEASGKVTWTGKLNWRIGFNYDSKDGLKNDSISPKVSSEFRFEGTLSIGLKMELYIDIIDEDLCKASVSTEAGIEAEAKAKLALLPEEEKDFIHDCNLCFAGVLNAKLKVSVSLNLLKDVVEIKKDLVDDSTKISDFYFSDDRMEFGWSTCPYISYRASITVEDEAGDLVPEAEVTLYSKNKGISKAGKTDSSGKLVEYLPNGTYEVVVEKDSDIATGELTISDKSTALPLVLGNNVIIDSGTCGDNLTWALNEKYRLKISGTGTVPGYAYDAWGAYSDKITSIAIDNGITGIGKDAFAYYSKLRAVKLPESVTEIGKSAFIGCSSLLRVNIPDQVTNIRREVFNGCSSLATINIPDRVTGIGMWAFRECSSLMNINIPDGVTGIGEGAFRECSSLTGVKIPDTVINIGHNIFYNCSSIETITIPGSVTDIAYCAFSGCSNLRELVIQDGVTSIGIGAFEGCTSLTDINIPGSVTKLEHSAFRDCSNLANISMAEGVTSIGDYVFSGCIGMSSIVIPDTMQVIGEGAFSGCIGLTNIAIPNQVTDIGGCAFENCTGLTSITIPEGVTAICDNTFEGCSNLSDIKMPGSLTQIGNEAFKNCSSLIGISIPESVVTIGRYAFAGCSNLTGMRIPEKMTGIETAVFLRCSSLAEVHIPGSVTTIGAYAFKDCSSLINVTLPENLTAIGQNVFENCNSLTSIIIPRGVTDISNYSFHDCTGLTDVMIEEGVVSIGVDAFANCTNLTNISIPESIKSIGNEAFEYCSNLADIKIPEGLTSIGNTVFSGCRSLEKINIPNGVTVIGARAFSQCPSLTDIKIPGSVINIGESAFYGCTGLTDIEIPEGVRDIGGWAFHKCYNLTNISIAQSVTNIGRAAFTDCGKQETILFKGDKPSMDTFCDWKATAYYPQNNATWEGISDSHTGVIWIPYDPANPPTMASAEREEDLKPATVDDEIDLDIVLDGFEETEDLWSESSETNGEEGDISETDSYDLENGAESEGSSEQGTESITDTELEILIEDVILQEDGLLPDNVITVPDKPEDIIIEEKLPVMYSEAVPASDTQSSVYTKLVPGASYVFTVVKDKDAQDLFAPENLLYIAQKNADQEGTLSFSYTLKNGDGQAATVIYGKPPKAPETEEHSHVTGDWIITKAATCTDSGMRMQKCTVCNETVHSEMIPAAGHSYGEAAVTKRATCAGSGVKTYTCTVCGVVRTEIIVKTTVHTWNSWQTVSQATVFSAEKQSRSCAVCGQKEERSIGTKLKPTIKVNATKIPLKVKQSTTKLKVSGLAAGDSVVSWKSGNTKIVKVSRTGKITAQKKTGKATVTITLASGLRKKISVTVQKGAVKTSKISNIQKKVSMKKGKKLKLAPILTPITSMDKITYSTSNKKVATVSKKGVIIARASGKAKITVKSGNKKVVVTVTVAKTAPTALKGVPTARTLKKGKTLTLKPKLIPQDAEAKIIFKSSNSKVASVNTKGKITAKKKGKAVITVMAGKVKTTCEVTVK